MARAGQDESKAAQDQYMKNSNTAFQGSQAGIAAFNKNIGTLDRGGQVGADPWLSPTYLANQNKLTANAVSGENDAAGQALRQDNLRSGGLNTTSTTAGIRDMALRKMRMNDVLNAQRSAQDYGKNVEYQRDLARAPLDATAAENGAYSTSTSGEGSALHDLSSFGLASYGPWNQLIGGISGAAGAVGGAYAGK